MSFWEIYFLMIFIGITVSVAAIYCINKNKIFTFSIYDKEQLMPLLQGCFILAFIPILNWISGILLVAAVLFAVAFRVTMWLTSIGLDKEIEKKRNRH